MVLKLMKKLFISVLVLTIWSCSKKEEKNSVPEQRIEITPFKINKVQLIDTQSIRTVYLLSDSGRMSIAEYQYNWGKDYKYLDFASFSALRKAVWALVKAPGSKVFVNPLEKASGQKEVQDRIIQCGMVEESTFDADGNEIITSKFNCDSLSTIRHINQIRFFESWYFNSQTNMVERELLGYSVHEYVADKNAFRELFNVFVNDAAAEKARKYYFNKQAQ
jgi:hypothetical protein